MSLIYAMIVARAEAMRYVDRQLRLTADEIRLRYLPYCYVLVNDGTVIISNRDYVPIWLYKKARENQVKWIRAVRPTAFCRQPEDRGEHFYNDGDVGRARDVAPDPDRSRERYETAVLDTLSSRVTAAMRRTLGVGLPPNWDLEDRNNEKEAWERDDEIPLYSTDSFLRLCAMIAPDGLQPVGASPDEILLGTQWDSGPYDDDFIRYWWQTNRSLAVDSIPFWEWVSKLRPTGRRLLYDYFLQDSKDELIRKGPWACCAGIENSTGAIRAIWRELRGKYVAQGGNYDAWYDHPGIDFRNKLTGVMKVCPNCVDASNLTSASGAQKVQVPWKDHTFQCFACRKWICVDHALACAPMMTYSKSDAIIKDQRHCGNVFCEDCINGHVCGRGNPTIKSSGTRQVGTTVTGYFYLIQMIPDIHPRRIKTGYTARQPHSRVIEYCRTGSPTCELLAAWECESREGERAARTALFDGVNGIRHVKGEVYDVDDIPALIQQAARYFRSEPFQDPTT